MERTLSNSEVRPALSWLLDRMNHRGPFQMKLCYYQVILWNWLPLCEFWLFHRTMQVPFFLDERHISGLCSIFYHAGEGARGWGAAHFPVLSGLNSNNLLIVSNTDKWLCQQFSYDGSFVLISYTDVSVQSSQAYDTKQALLFCSLNLISSIILKSKDKFSKERKSFGGHVIWK